MNYRWRHWQEALAFGQERGWKYVEEPFTLNQLAARSRRSPFEYGEPNPVDHPYYYVDPQGRPTAIVGHEYDGALPRAHLGAHPGVRVEIAEDHESFYFPGQCTVVLFVPKSVTRSRRGSPKSSKSSRRAIRDMPNITSGRGS